MKYPYTWNHINLLAKLCENIDDKFTITSSWISIVESHHSSTFPFTLWPLTYRTSDVTTSPSICSPVLLQFPGIVCDIAIKIYECNEVIIVCVQNEEIISDSESKCEVPCRVAGSKPSTIMNHRENHCEDVSSRLLPCNVSRVYPRIKETVLPQIYKSYIDSKGSIKCVTFVGHGFSASIASCLASDIGITYESQKEHLGLDEKEVNVDLVVFSNTPLASSGYWESVGGSIDNYISVNLSDENNPRNVLIPNPLCSYIVLVEKDVSIMKPRSKFVGEKEENNRSMFKRSGSIMKPRSKFVGEKEENNRSMFKRSGSVIKPRSKFGGEREENNRPMFKRSGSVMKILSKLGGGKSSDSTITSISDILSELDKKISPEMSFIKK